MTLITLVCLYGLMDTGCFGGTGPQGGSLVLAIGFSSCEDFR